MLYFRPLTGDLTRIGALPEVFFAPNTIQKPLYRINHRLSSSSSNYLIIGDSFTGEGFWQQFAIPPNSDFSSYNFGKVCHDFDSYIATLNLSSTTVIVQLVERYFDERLLTTCLNSELLIAPENSTDLLTYPSSPSLFTGIYGPRYIFGSYSYMFLNKISHRSGDSGGVYIRNLPKGCLLFSNTDCTKSLFLGDDFTMTNTFSSSIASPFIQYLKNAGFSRIILVVIPNKSSVYLDNLDTNRSKDLLVNNFAQFNGIENIPLFVSFYHSSRKILDYYRPNDTHLSHNGYLSLGTIISSYLTDIKSSL